MAPQFVQHRSGLSSAVLPTRTARAFSAVSRWTRSSMMCHVRYRWRYFVATPQNRAIQAFRRPW